MIFCHISTLYPHFIHTLRTIINESIAYVSKTTWQNEKSTSQFFKKIGIFIAK